ncbi:MAG TPA: hypothetical protein GXZ89_04515 [Fastidiosipila sp.]|nr:hypothetical protein [Fastidiosipila sp.]
MKKGRLEHWFGRERIIQYVLILLALIPPLYYIFGPLEGLLHSDFTDTIYWAKTSVESGRMLDPNFAYAGILPFGANLWYIPLLLMFGLTMTVQKIGLVIFLLLFVFAICFVGKTLGLSPIWRGLTVFVITLGLSQSEKTLEIMWGHVIYYSLGALLYFLGLALMIRSSGFFSERFAPGDAQYSVLYAASGRRRLLYFILFMLLTIGTGTNGFQMMAMYMLPLAGALVLERLFERRSQLHDPITKDVVWQVLAMIFATFVGVVLLVIMRRGGVRAPYAHLYSMYSETARWGDNAGRLLPSLYRLFDLNPQSNDLIFNPLTLHIPLKLAAIALIIVVPIIYTRKFDARPRALRLVILAHWIQTAILLYTFVFGLMSSAPWRLVPLIISSLFICMLAVHEWLTKRKKHETTVRYRLAHISLTILLVFSLFGALKIFSYSPDYQANPHLHTLKTVLEERELRHGYASFWHAQAINLLSDDRIKIRTVEPTENGIVKRHYQTRSNWFEDQPGVDRYFLALAWHELAALESAGQLEHVLDGVIDSFDTDHYTVYIYPFNIMTHPPAEVSPEPTVEDKTEATIP